jgi:hypothetical protein
MCGGQKAYKIGFTFAGVTDLMGYFMAGNERLQKIRTSCIYLSFSREGVVIT